MAMDNIMRQEVAPSRKATSRKTIKSITIRNTNLDGNGFKKVVKEVYNMSVSLNLWFVTIQHITTTTSTFAL